MDNCIFCKIVDGQIPSTKVYEDNDFLAFMDINPMAIGHTLVIPKNHFRNALDTTDEVASKMYIVVIKVANAVKKAFNASGINIIQNNEASSGQEVFHSHIHIIPRYDNDNLGLKVPPRLKQSIEEINTHAEKIRNAF